jgi:HK97 family phage prohead protease
VKLRHLPVEFRAAPYLGEGVVVGLVTKYDVEYRIGYSLKESIASHAFDASIASQESFPIFYEHDWTAGPIGTASMRGTDEGVEATATLFIDDDPRARSVYRAMQTGALREWSIGFMPTTITTSSDDPSLEIIEAGDLIEASVVVRGANPGTDTVEVRSEDKKSEPPKAPELHPDAWRLLAHSGARIVAGVLVQ